MAGITAVVTKTGVWGDTNYAVVELTPDSDNYPSGGESVDFPAILSWDTLTAVLSLQSSKAGGYVPQWDATNSKLKFFEAGADAAALDEVVTGDLSAQTVTATVIGVV